MDTVRRIIPTPVKNLIRPVFFGVLNGNRLLVRLTLRSLALVLGKNLLLHLSHFVARELDTVIEVDGIKFDAGDARPMERAETLLTKEPDTINWINRYVSTGEVFYDVGANIGVYSLYAAAKKGARVIAFEPMCTNYDILNRNIHLNRLGDRITALNIALHDQTTLSHLNLSEFTAGKAGHGFVRPMAGSHDEEFVPVFRQGVLGLAMDDFVERYDQPFPNHVKIDTDGSEPYVIAGMSKILADQRLRSIAIELDPDNRQADHELLKDIESFGFERLAGPDFTNLFNVSWTNVRNYFLVRR